MPRRVNSTPWRRHSCRFCHPGLRERFRGVATAEASARSQVTARFDTVFVGIETPELGALKSIHKGYNAASPMLLFNLMLRLGVAADYRRHFWRLIRTARDTGALDALLGVGLASYHLIEFSREALRGAQNASFYSAKTR